MIDELIYSELAKNMAAIAFTCIVRPQRIAAAETQSPRPTSRNLAAISASSGSFIPMPAS
jgi:hypothetical protein